MCTMYCQVITCINPLHLLGIETTLNSTNLFEHFKVAILSLLFEQYTYSKDGQQKKYIL